MIIIIIQIKINIIIIIARAIKNRTIFNRISKKNFSLTFS